MKQGFSLVELSIVLVILGLITGGILTGQSLIRASELRSVGSDIQKYQAAAHTFRDKYFGIPGDFRDATRFWNRAANVADCVTNSGTAVGAPGTCDGNGDGTIVAPAGANQYGEYFLTWQHMAYAGLIEGTYSGQAGPNGGAHGVFDTNIPRSKISNGGYTIQGVGNVTCCALFFTGSYGNTLIFGARHGTTGPTNPILKPEEMWNIDTKMDDGRPAYGNIVTFSATFRPNCATSDTPSAAEYSLATATATCALVARNYF